MFLTPRKRQRFQLNHSATIAVIFGHFCDVKTDLNRYEDEGEGDGENDEQFWDPSDGGQVPVTDSGEGDHDKPEGVEEVERVVGASVLDPLQVVDATHAESIQFTSQKSVICSRD